MNVSLTPHFEDFIQALVGTGKYHSASEVVRDALRLLQEKEELAQQQKQVLKSILKDGIKSGKPIPMDLTKILKQAKEERDSRSDENA